MDGTAQRPSALLVEDGRHPQSPADIHYPSQHQVFRHSTWLDMSESTLMDRVYFTQCGKFEILHNSTRFTTCEFHCPWVSARTAEDSKWFPRPTFPSVPILSDPGRTGRLTLLQPSINVRNSPGLDRSRLEQSGLSPVQCGVILDWNRISLTFHRTVSNSVWTDSGLHCKVKFKLAGIRLIME